MHVVVGQGQLDSVLQSKPEDRAGLHRGGGRRPQAPQAQGEGAAQARRDAGQPDPADRPHRRAAPPAQAARPAGGDRPPGPDHPVRAARLPAPAGRRRPGHPARRAGPRGGRRVAGQGPPRRGRGAAVGGPGRAGAAGAGAGRRTRRGWPPPRTPGTGCPRWPSGCAGTVRLAQERTRHLADPQERTPGRDPDELDAEADADRRAGGRAGRGGRRRPGAGWPTSPRSAPTPSAGWPRPSGRTWPRCARWPTAGPGWPRWPGGPRRCAAGPRPPPRRSSGCPRRCPRRWTGSAPPRPSWPRPATSSASWTTTPCASWSGAARRRSRRTRRPAGGWPSWSPGSARPSSSGRTGGPGSTRCRSGWPAATAPARCSTTARPAGVLGPLAELITVEPWARAALAAALGELTDAVAVDSPAAAVESLRLLRRRDAGRAALLVGPSAPPPGPHRPVARTAPRAMQVRPKVPFAQVGCGSARRGAGQAPGGGPGAGERGGAGGARGAPGAARGGRRRGSRRRARSWSPRTRS